MSRKLLLMAAALGMSCGVFAADAWVTMFGNDTTGTVGDSSYPFATISAAVTALGSEGGTVYITAGTYTISAWLEISTPVVLKGSGDNPSAVTLVGNGSVRVLKLNNANAGVENLTITGGYFTNAKTEAPGLTLYNGTVSNCVIKANTANANWSVAANVYQSGGLITCCVIENGVLNNQSADYADYHPRGAYLLGTAHMTKCLFKNYGSSSYGNIVQLNSSNALLEKCTITDSTLSYRKATPGYGVYVNSGTVRDCVMVGVRHLGTTISGTYYPFGPAPWGGNAAAFDNCVTDSAEPINANCYTVATDAAFADISAGDYSPAPGGVIAAHNAGAIACRTEAFDASFSVDCREQSTAYAFTFTATSANASGAVTYQWDFDGDGNYDTDPSSSPSAQWTYSATGTYSPVLKAVSGGDEVTATRSELVTVGAAEVQVSNATDLRDAVTAAKDGTTILVADGIYSVSAPLTLEHAVRLIGTDPSRCIISNTATSGGGHNLLVLNHADAFAANFSLQKGRVVTAPSEAGGVTIRSNGGTVSNCVITACVSSGNQSQVASALMYAGLITHTIFEKGAQDNGQHMGNGTRKAGGALLLGAAKISNSLFREFSSSGYGHIIWSASAAAVVENCTVVNSSLSSENNGANVCYGIYCSSGTIRNCAAFGISRIAVGANPATDYASWGGTAANFVNCATDGDAAINENCLLSTKEAAFKAYVNGDYLPSAGGVLKDAGAEATIIAGVDLAGGDRVCGDAIDIGCYEMQITGLAVDFQQSVDEGVIPASVTFTATPVGAVGDCTYDWDFDGDGNYDVTGVAEASVVHVYSEPGTYTVRVRVTDSTSAVGEGEKSDCVRIAPALIEVSDVASLYEAVAAGFAGTEIRVAAGVYQLTAPVVLDEAVTLKGATGNPADVVLTNATHSVGHHIAHINNAASSILNMTLAGGYEVHGGLVNQVPHHYAAGVTIGLNGGMVSNCVIRLCDQYSNQGEAGGAYMNSGLITHTVFDNCSMYAAEMMGVNYKAGGVVVLGDARISNCLFKNFTSASKGAIVWMDGALASADNCTVVNSSVDYSYGNGFGTVPGYAIRVVSGTVKNCLVLGVNRVEGGSSAADVASCGGTLSVFVNCATEDAEPVNGNCISCSRATAVRDYENGKYAPKAGGPLVDAGAVIANAPATDLAGKSRLSGDAIDIGCYESNGSGFIIIVR